MATRALALTILLVVAGLSGLAVGAPPAYDTTGQHSHTLVPGTYAPLPWESANLTSNVDGKNIHIAWSRPATDVPVPIVLDVSPYFGGSIETSQTLMPFLKDEIEPHGYAVGGIAVRGTSYSGGCIEMFGPNEMADIDQAITYVATRSWSNGNVGLYGSSYEGSTPWEAAATGNPHLKAIVPMNGIPSLRDLMFHNGTAHSANGPVITSVYSAESAARVTDGRSNEDNVAIATDTAACPEGAKGTGFSQQATLTGSDDALGYWDARDFRDRIVERYHGAVFSVMGLTDWNVPPHAQIPFAQELADRGLDVRQLYHKGEHFWPDTVFVGPATMRWDWAEILLEWFDQHLKGAPPSTLGHPAEVQSPDGRWWGLDSFPPTSVTRDVYELGVDGLAQGEPGADGSTILTPQGWNGNRFTDVAGPMPVAPGSSYQADLTFAAATTVSGLVRLHATVVPAGPGGDLTAWLLDVAPDGSATRVAWGQMDLAYADGGDVRHVVVPGQPLVARLEFEPQHFVLEAGHALRLRVWQYSIAENAPGLVVTPIVLEYGASHPSTLDLPLVPTAGAFVPPGASVAPPRTASGSYQTLQSPTVTFAVRPGEMSSLVTIVDAAIPASGNFHVCEDANGNGVCGEPGEYDGYGCYQNTVPLHGSGTLSITVYSNSNFAPAGAKGTCTVPTQLATLTGTVQATFYAS